jgi:hypothetical protein
MKFKSLLSKKKTEEIPLLSKDEQNSPQEFVRLLQQYCKDNSIEYIPGKGTGKRYYFQYCEKGVYAYIIKKYDLKKVKLTEEWNNGESSCLLHFPVNMLTQMIDELENAIASSKCCKCCC